MMTRAERKYVERLEQENEFLRDTLVNFAIGDLLPPEDDWEDCDCCWEDGESCEECDEDYDFADDEDELEDEFEDEHGGDYKYGV